MAQPPLYKVQLGKEGKYVFNEDNLEKVKAEMLAAKKSSSQKGKTAPAAKTKDDLSGSSSEEGETESATSISVQRYKGLGEMNPSQLWETTMDPERRVMKKIIIEDAEKADEVFDILMGDEVAPRKHFIHTHAKLVKNLDI